MLRRTVVADHGTDAETQGYRSAMAHKLALLLMLSLVSWSVNAQSSLESSCQKVREGFCIQDVLNEMDSLLEWPASVDLYVRMYEGKGFEALQFLQSVTLFWPKGLGDVVAVLDSGEDHVRDLLPPWVKVYYQDYKNALGTNVQPFIMKEWSALWADNYTTSDYIGFCDTDMVFTTKVTPDLLFRNKKPIMFGRAIDTVWREANDALLGKELYYAQFMYNLPMLIPRKSLAAMREHMMTANKQSSLEAVFQQLYALKDASKQVDARGKYISTFSVMGNYLWFKNHDDIEWAIEGGTTEPALRCAEHVPYSHAYVKNYGGKADWFEALAGQRSKISRNRFVRAAHAVHEGLCNVFPDGALENCKPSVQMQGSMIQWEAAYGTPNWGKHIIDPVYKAHFGYMRELYDKSIARLKAGTTHS